MTVTRRDKSSISPTAGGGRDIPASPSAWQRLIGEDGLQKWAFYAPVAFMILFFAIPMMLTVVWSVFERTQFWMEPGFTLFAYENFFNSARVENYLYSMIHSAWAVVISFALGFPIAVFVRRRVPKVAQHRVILLFILPFMISELVRVFAMRPILGRYGILNTFFMNIGLIDEPITVILFSPLGVIIGDVVSFLPFMVFAGFLAMEAVQLYVFEVCDDLEPSATLSSHWRHQASSPGVCLFLSTAWVWPWCRSFSADPARSMRA